MKRTIWETQILTVKMLADEAIKIIRAMLESNRMVIVSITPDDYFNIPLRWLDHLVSVLEMEDIKEITINSISPIIPTYSVWDKVMILATGEIGSISKLRDEAREKPIEINNDTDQFYHRSEICKIA